MLLTINKPWETSWYLVILFVDYILNVLNDQKFIIIFLIILLIHIIAWMILTFHALIRAIICDLTFIGIRFFLLVRMRFAYAWILTGLVPGGFSSRFRSIIKHFTKRSFISCLSQNLRHPQYLKKFHLAHLNPQYLKKLPHQNFSLANLDYHCLIRWNYVINPNLMNVQNFILL